jgi:ketosteroid isomerase-like protein
MRSVRDLDEFQALDPFFGIIEEGVAGLVDGKHFFDLLAVVPTGAPYGNHYISVLTIRDRRIVHWRDYLDPLVVFDAVGWPETR